MSGNPSGLWKSGRQQQPPECKAGVTPTTKPNSNLTSQLQHLPTPCLQPFSDWISGARNSSDQPLNVMFKGLMRIALSLFAGSRPEVASKTPSWVCVWLHCSTACPHVQRVNQSRNKEVESSYQETVTIIWALNFLSNAQIPKKKKKGEIEVVQFPVWIESTGRYLRKVKVNWNQVKQACLMKQLGPPQGILAHSVRTLTWSQPQQRTIQPEKDFGWDPLLRNTSVLAFTHQIHF